MKKLWLRLKFLGIHTWWMIVVMWLAIISTYLYSVLLPILRKAFDTNNWQGDVCLWFCMITYTLLTISLIIIVFLKIYKNIQESSKQLKECK